MEYIADDHGFRAVVKKLGTPIHPIPESHIQSLPAGITPYAPSLPVKETYQPQLPVYEQYGGAYNGQYQNYVPEVKPEYVYPAPVKVEQQYYQQPAPLVTYYPKPVETYYPKPAEAPKPVPVVSYEPKQEEPEEKVEYHGFTGNSDDDAAYTKHDDGEEENEEYNEGNYEYEESKPAVLTVPYNVVQGYQKQPLVYLIKQYPGY